MKVIVTCQCGKQWVEDIEETMKEDLFECTVLPDGSFDGRDLDMLCPDCEYTDQMSITRDWDRR